MYVSSIGQCAKIAWRWAMAGLLSVVLSVPLCGQAFSCDGAFFLATATNEGSQLHRIERTPGTGAIRATQIPLSEPARRLTCLGISLQDLYLYALDFNTYELLRIDRSGRITNLGVPENLDTKKFDYYAGEVGPGGGSLTVIARDKITGYDKALYNISLTGPRYFAGPLPVTAASDIAIADLATDPTTGVRYGFDKIARKVVILNGGTVTTYKYQDLPASAGAMFFDREGELFLYGDPKGGNSHSRLFYFNKNTGKAGELWQGPSGGEADGCSCPYTVTFSRTVNPPVVLPCSEVEIEYRVLNYSGVGRLSTVLEDDLPAPFTITAVEPANTTIFVLRSGPGSSRLRMENFEIIVRENILRVRARVDESPPGRYLSQAAIKNWPAGFGEIRSDNPATGEPADPNPIVIADPEKLDVEPEVFYTCNRDSIYARLPVRADYYRWSDGSSGPVLAVSRPGEYWVEAGSDCWVLRDTFRLEAPPPRLQVGLGEDRRVRIAQEISIPVITNAGRGATYAWSVSGAAEPGCVSCPELVIRPAGDVMVTLTLTDTSGCQAADSVAISVNPVRKVYVPNAFSPDGDGVNDRFFIEGPVGELGYLRVFDRWGAVLFERSGGKVGDPDAGWDGKSRGREAVPGVYLVSALVIFPDGAEEVVSGELALIRAR